MARRFRNLRARIRLLFWLDGTARNALALCAFVVATFALDFLFNLPAAVRLTFLGAGILGFAWLTWRRVIRPFFVPISDDDLALFIERHHPELNDRLISAIQLSRRTADEVEGTIGFNSPELVEALIREADDLAGRIEFRRILMVKNVVWMNAGAMAFSLVLALLALWQPRYASIYVQRAMGLNVKWPQKFRVHVLDFDDSRTKVIERGREKFTVRVRLEKLATVTSPDEVYITYRYGQSDAKEEVMTPVGDDQFDFTFERVTGPFTFSVKGGDDETELYSVDTLTPPTIDRMRLFHAYPRYLGMKDTPDQQPLTERNVTAPLGTRVRFEAEVQEPLREAWIAIGPKGRESVEALQIADRTVRGEFTVTETYGEYEFRLVARNSLPNRENLRYTIHGLEDRKPEFKRINPSVESEDVTEICLRPLEFEVRDDHGIDRIVIQYQVRGERSTDWREIVVTPEMMGRREDGERQRRGDRVIRVRAELDFAKIELPGPDNTTVRLRPGDHVYVRYRAQDFKEPAANVEVSPEIHFSVKSIADIEKAIQEEIDRIKRVLIDQRRKQEDEYRRTDSLQRKLTAETLGADQQKDLRDAKLEQNGIADRLTTARQDLRRVRERGVYNRIFDEASARRLENPDDPRNNPGAADILGFLVGDPNRREEYGVAMQAVQALEEAGGARDRRERDERFTSARGFQKETFAGIQRALDMLEKWANYQEVIRITREILEIQKWVNRMMSGQK